MPAPRGKSSRARRQTNKTCRCWNYWNPKHLKVGSFTRILNQISGRFRCMTAWSRGSAFPEKTPPAAKSDAAAAPARRVRSRNCFRPRSGRRRRRIFEQRVASGIAQAAEQMTWDNAVWIFAQERGTLRRRDRRRGRDQLSGRKVEGARVGCLPGHADESLIRAFGIRAHARRKNRGQRGIRTRMPCRQRARAPHARARRLRESGTDTSSPTRNTPKPWRSSIRSAVGTLAEYHQRLGVRQSRSQALADDHTMFPLWDYNKGQQMGHVDRPDALRRLPGVHGRLSGGKIISPWWARSRWRLDGT